jgi:hypothetical protein
MQRLVTFTEEEFKNKFKEFVDNFVKQSEKDYGVKLHCNETKMIIHDKESVLGSLMMSWDETFK